MPSLGAGLAGNRRAMELAQASRIVMQANDAAISIAASLTDDLFRVKTLDILRSPAPTYQLRSPTRSDKEALRQELLAAGVIPEETTVEGIFPPVADPNEPPQAFWSAPGGGNSGHHAFPGGLAVHVWVNAVLARSLVETYETVYGLRSVTHAVDPNVALAAPLWHDIHKVTVLQWNDDGTVLGEQRIAGAGAHHPLSGAEAIVRGMPPAFVVALLAAHNPPMATSHLTATGEPQPVINYLRAAAMIARVDPVEAGLLARLPDEGWALSQNPPRPEGYINNLADHDYLLSGDSATVLAGVMKELAPQYGFDPAADSPRFNWWRNAVFSRTPDMRLYGALATGGRDAVKAMIDAEAGAGAV